MGVAAGGDFRALHRYGFSLDGLEKRARKTDVRVSIPGGQTAFAGNSLPWEHAKDYYGIPWKYFCPEGHECGATRDGDSGYSSGFSRSGRGSDGGLRLSEDRGRARLGLRGRYGQLFPAAAEISGTDAGRAPREQERHPVVQLPEVLGRHRHQVR